MAAKGGRAFACPGLFRIVPALDGGICRIKLPLGELTAAQARAIADITDAHAGGIEATNRANIQIRGVRPGAEDAVVAALRAVDLGAANAGADDIRNVMVSPLAGLDPDQIQNVRPLATALLDRLQADTRYHALSPKFSLLIDGGEGLAMVEHPSDLWLSAVDADTFAFGFAGCPTQDSRDVTAGLIAASDARDLALSALDFFLRFNGTPDRNGHEIVRFRHLIAEIGLAEILAALPSSAQPHDTVWRRKTPRALAHLGRQQQRTAGQFAIGALPPLGRLTAPMLRGLADLAEKVAGGNIRMTPWQSVMLTDLSDDNAQFAGTMLEALGFVTGSKPALARIVTCAGRAGCGSAHADTKADATTLAAKLDGLGTSVFGIHVTGCSKSCAAPRPAEVTLVAIGPGHYDAFRRDPSAGGKFGRPIGTNLTIEQASEILARGN